MSFCRPFMFLSSQNIKNFKKKKTHKNKDQNIRFCKNQQQTWFKKNYGTSQILNQNHNHSTPQIPQPPFDPLLPTSNQIETQIH